MTPRKACHSRIFPGNYYDILGVPKSDTKEEVHKQYLKLSSEYHPDRLATKPAKARKEAEDRLKQIVECMEVLCDDYQISQLLRSRSYDAINSAERSSTLDVVWQEGNFRKCRKLS